MLPPRPIVQSEGESHASTAAPDLANVCSRLGLTLTPSQQTALMSYLALLQRWNRIYNLTAVRDPAAMFTQHLADCLAVVPPVQTATVHLKAARVLDVGSGGGLPAVVLAVCLPAVQLSCIDAVGKKMAFVRQVAGELRLQNLQAVHGRIEDLRAPPFALITARAFASLADLVRLTRPVLAEGGVWMAMKGRVPDEELAALSPDIDVFHVEQLQVPGLDAQRCLVWMRPR
jgi:16S rRNA (guanine527-N7)-methyltransferase